MAEQEIPWKSPKYAEKNYSGEGRTKNKAQSGILKHTTFFN